MARKHLIKIFYGLIFGIPLIFAFRDIVSGSIPFWYDPARDLLAAQDNLQKLSLIGPTTGIPNVFYGPYWIWLLSVALLISRDPKVITLLTLTIPYFLILPFILFRFKKIIPHFPIAAVWLMFILGFPIYATQLWNPNLAPLLLFGFSYLLITLPTKELNKKTLLQALLTGFTGGVLANFHLSFGIGLVFASSLYALLLLVKLRKKETVLSIVSFFIGIALAFAPFMAFEVRHGFNQIQALIFTFSNSFFYNSAVVGQVGLSRADIISHFLALPDKALQLPTNLALFILGFLGLTYFFKFKRDASFRLVLFLVLTLPTVAYIYFSSKNPVWDYHFIALDALVILLLGVLASRHRLGSWAITVYTLLLLAKAVWFFPEALNQNVLSFPSLASKQGIVTHIYKDSAASPFKVDIYSPSLYTFDYDYLFKTFGPESFQGKVPVSDNKIVYLVIPQASEEVKVDFINYKTPNDRYQTVSEQEFPDGTIVIRRELLDAN